MRLNWKVVLKQWLCWMPFIAFASLVLNLHYYDWQYWVLFLTVLLVRVSDSLTKDR